SASAGTAHRPTSTQSGPRTIQRRYRFSLLQALPREGCGKRCLRRRVGPRCPRMGVKSAAHSSSTSAASASFRFSRFLDRKSTRLNSSHSQISYAVFCLKKKKKKKK